MLYMAETGKTTVRLSEEWIARLDAFCAKTNRDRPETVRAISRLFFADGDMVAEARLSRNVWVAAPDAAQDAVRAYEVAKAHALPEASRGAKASKGKRAS